MANTIIRIKRSGTSGNPSTLAQGELAYSWLTDNGSNGGQRLYIGTGTETDGDAVNHVVIGGEFFTEMLDHAKGTLTASSAVIVDANKKIDEFNVDNINLNGNTVSTTNADGNLLLSPNGTGKVQVSGAYTLPNADGAANTYLKTNGSGAVSFSTLPDATTTTKGIASFDATDFSVNSGAVTLQAERIQDIVGAMVSNNTESGISVTYDDTDGTLDFDVNDPTITISGDADGSATMTNLGNVNIAITLDTVNANVGTFGSSTAIPVVTVNGKGLVTGVSTASISTTLNISGDSGTDGVSLGTDTLDFEGGANTGISTAVTDNKVTISGIDASTTVKGVASFNSASFSTSSGAVSIKTGGISNLQLANDDVTIGSTTVALGATSTSLAGLTEVAVDNLNFNGNTISSTDTNGNIILDPNGVGTVDVNGAKITSVGAPAADTDAATKAYVDSVAQGLRAVPAAKAATTGNLTATYNHAAGTLTATGNGAFPTVDGVTFAQGDNLVVKNQTNAYQNGSYILTTVGSAGAPWVLTRCSFWNEQSEIPGMFEFVTAGTTLENTGWVTTVPSDFTFGSTDASADPGFTTKGDIVWVQFSGAGSYIAGDGLDLSGTTFSVKVSSTGGIEISSDALQLKSTVAGAGLTLTDGVLAVGGTTNRITVNADSIDIASTYVGQSTITTVGTIGSGTWNGNTIGTGYGGTGLTTYTTGDLLYASGTNTLAKLAVGTAGQVLQLNASTGAIEWNGIDGGSY